VVLSVGHSNYEYTQEVIGDTTIQSKLYAILLDTNMDTLYWFERADTSRIYSYNKITLEEGIVVDFNTPDTSGFITIVNDSIIFWGSNRARQTKIVWDGIGITTHRFIKGIGLSSWSYYDHPPDEQIDLVAGIIEGVFYGDSTVLGTERIDNEIISDFSLSQNYPNPFNPSTKIKFVIPSANSPLPGGARGGFVTLKVYSILGREIATLVNEEKPEGEYEVEFNGSNLPSGIYFYQLKAGGFVQTKKMILLK